MSWRRDLKISSINCFISSSISEKSAGLATSLEEEEDEEEDEDEEDEDEDEDDEEESGFRRA